MMTAARTVGGIVPTTTIVINDSTSTIDSTETNDGTETNDSNSTSTSASTNTSTNSTAAGGGGTVEAMFEQTWAATQAGGNMNNGQAVSSLLRLLNTPGGREYALNHKVSGYFGADLSLYHWAAYSGSADVVEELIRSGQNPKSTNGKGETALDIAKRRFKGSVVSLLQDHSRMDGLTREAADRDRAGQTTDVSNESNRRAEGALTSTVSPEATPLVPTTSVNLTPQPSGRGKRDMREGRGGGGGGGEGEYDDGGQYELTPDNRYSKVKPNDSGRLVIGTPRGAVGVALGSPGGGFVTNEEGPHTMADDLADALATCDLKTIQKALMAAKMQLNKYAPNQGGALFNKSAVAAMVRRCEQAEAKLIMNFQAINHGESYDEQAEALIQLARGVMSQAWPYAAHMVVLYARHVIAEDAVALGGPTGAQDKAREAQRMIATEYNRVCEELGHQLHPQPSPTNRIFMESVCKILPFPSEVHIVPSKGSYTPRWVGGWPDPVVFDHKVDGSIG